MTVLGHAGPVSDRPGERSAFRSRPCRVFLRATRSVSSLSCSCRRAVMISGRCSSAVADARSRGRPAASSNGGRSVSRDALRPHRVARSDRPATGAGRPRRSRPWSRPRSRPPRWEATPASAWVISIGASVPTSTFLRLSSSRSCAARATSRATSSAACAARRSQYASSTCLMVVMASQAQVLLGDLELAAGQQDLDRG